MAVLLLYISLPSPVPPVPDVRAEQKPEQLWTKFHFDNFARSSLSNTKLDSDQH